MNKFAHLFLGVFGLFGASWLAFVAYPYITFAGMQPNKDSNTGAVAPQGNPGTTEQGARVFAANGCVYCHSQFVRGENEGADIDRGWGKRRTVARDYMFDHYVFLGNSRLGADLANIGVRQTDPQWFYRLLYDPRSVHPESVMPSFRYLFRTQKISGQASADALKLNGPGAPRSGYEIVPTEEGKAIVAYLISLKKNYALPEAPEPAE
ncbi:MAG TPA: cbb3-type cytochrome c oxidase subunit II [Chthoniobacterales bacterium]|nr:cbb3-type cytochrome c oxidase subunit II [Chthoniobacterales bacterium]